MQWETHHSLWAGLCGIIIQFRLVIPSIVTYNMFLMTESYFKINIISLCFIITCTIKNLTSKQSVAHEDIVEIQSANIYNHLVKKCTYIQRNSQVYINIVIFYCRYTHLERNLTCTCRLSARLLHWNSYQESYVWLPRPFLGNSICIPSKGSTESSQCLLCDELYIIIIISDKVIVFCKIRHNKSSYNIWELPPRV